MHARVTCDIFALRMLVFNSYFECLLSSPGFSFMNCVLFLSGSLCPLKYSISQEQTFFSVVEASNNPAHTHLCSVSVGTEL